MGISVIPRHCQSSQTVKPLHRPLNQSIGRDRSALLISIMNALLRTGPIHRVFKRLI